jgi:hypothetical protein
MAQPTVIDAWVRMDARDDIGEAVFVVMRTQRDATLDVPMLIWPAIQISIRAGALLTNEDNGMSGLKIPLNALCVGVRKSR